MSHTSVQHAQPPAWDWNADLSPGERLELHELRQVVAEQRSDLDCLTDAHEQTKLLVDELQASLRRALNARFFRRRKVLVEARERGLL